MYLIVARLIHNMSIYRMMYVVLDVQTEYYTHTHEKCRLHMEF